MFPIENFETAENQDSFSWGITFDFDFDECDFVLIDGQLKELTGLEALKVWIKKIINTEKDRFDIYKMTNESYGLAVKEYLHSSDYSGLIYANIQNDLETALTAHPEIYNLDDFEFTRDKRTLSVKFTINTAYGQLTEGVEI